MRLLALVLSLAAGGAHAQFKCTAPGGAVSMQQAPCPPGHASAPLVLPPASTTPERPERIRHALSLNRVVLGMTHAEVTRAMGGEADRINRTVRGSGVDHQLVYRRSRGGSTYIYLTDGIVTSFSDSE